MASYQDQPAYQTYQVNPYQQPISEMVQAVATRNNYWDSAASSIKSAYQNYLGLDLSRQDNHQKLNQLMQGVNEQLKQVTQTDLSLGENYGRALSVFDPITKDDNIMGDNAITRHYKDQYSIAQGFRIKDAGKGYSDTNVRDLSNHLQDFVNDPNAQNWRQHYSTRSFYSPYHDVAAEIRQISKDFKPDVTTLSSPMYLDKDGRPTTTGGKPSGYLLNQTDKSIIASQYRAFVNSHLSDKARDQISLDGRVKYHDNMNALVQDYSSYNQDKINHYNSEIKSLKGALGGATDGQKDAIQSQIDNNEALVKELGLENTKMKAGDFSNVLPYKNQLSAQLYSDKYMDYLSKASAQKNVEMKYTPDQVWKTMYQEQNENSRFNIARQTQWDIANLNADTRLEVAGLKIKLGPNGQPLGGIQAYGIADKSNDEQFGRQKYNDLQSNSTKEFQDAVDQMNKKVAADKGVDPTDSKIPQETRDGAVSSWMADVRNKSDVDQYYKAAQKRSSEQQLFSGIDDYVNGVLSKQYPEIYNAKQSILNNIKTGDVISLREFKAYRGQGDAPGKVLANVNLSAQDVQKLLNGSSGAGLSMGYEERTTGVSGPGAVPNTSKVPVIRYNGKSYDFTSSALTKGLFDISRANGDFENKKNELLNQNITRIAGIEKIFQNDKNPYYNAAHQLTLRQVIGSDYVLKHDFVLLTANYKQGDVYFKVQGDSKVNIDKVKEKVVAAGGRYIKADDEFILPGKLYGNITGGQSFQDPRLSSIQTLVDFRSTATPNDRLTTAPQTWGNRNFSFKVDIQSGHPSYKIVDPYSGAVFGVDDKGNSFSSLESAASQATILGNLTPDQFLNIVKTIGGVPDYKQNKPK